MLKRVDHIEMAVDNVEAEVAFFKSLGFEEIARAGEAPKLTVQLKLPGENQVMFKIFLTKEGRKPGVDHISFELTEGEATREDMKGKGISFKDEGKFVAKYGHEVSNLVDPNGNKWQFTEIVGKH
jgi:catechol 2,3-dioxygenase-like lactoylglutathione lyase family enzyme